MCGTGITSRPITFLSTLPVRGATSRARMVEIAREFLSTLPVRGATTPTQTYSLLFIISIHAPREGSDLQYAVLLDRARQFLSTLPVRGATFPIQVL